MPTGQQLVEEFRRWLGTTYRFGGEQGDCGHPENIDCSEGVEWACRCAGVQPTMPDGSGNQFNHCDSRGLRIPLEQAKGIIGALLFKSYGTSYPPGDRNEGGIYHVAMVSGPDRTMEICCDDGDKVTERSISGRSWYGHACLVPGVDYSGAQVPSEPTPQPPDVQVTLEVEGGGTVSLRELRKGHEGRDVRQLQALLEEWAIDPGPHDGVFGGGTDQAVRTFQGARGLAADGIVGELTWTSLLGR